MNSYKLEWELEKISANGMLKHFIEKNKDNLTPFLWLKIEEKDCFSNEMIEKYAENLDWVYLSAFRKLPEKVMVDNAGRLDWFSISCFQALTYSFVKKHKFYLSWDQVIKNENISADHMAKIMALYKKEILPNKKEFEIISKNNLKVNTLFSKTKRKKIEQQTIKDFYIPFDFEKKKSKAQIKDYLEKVGIKILYKDTIEDLLKKVKEYEEKNNIQNQTKKAGSAEFLEVSAIKEKAKNKKNNDLLRANYTN